MIHMHVASFILSLLTHGLSTKQDIWACLAVRFNLYFVKF
jgi:hypothetical protein